MLANPKLKNYKDEKFISLNLFFSFWTRLKGIRCMIHKLIWQHIKINSIALKSDRYLGSTARIIAKVPVKFQSDGTQRVHDAIIKSLWYQNDVTTSFWLHNDVIIASRARWVLYSRSSGTLQERPYNKTSYWTLTLGHVSISNKTSYYKISQSFEAPKFVNNNCLILYWNLAGTSTAVLLMCLSNFEVICTF